MRDASKIVKLPDEPHSEAIRRFAKEGAYIAGDDKSSPWIPFGDVAAIKHLCFDVRNNAAANILWVKSGGRIGTHKHRGFVSAITLEGSWAITNTTGSPGPATSSTSSRERRTRSIPTIRMA